MCLLRRLHIAWGWNDEKEIFRDWREGILMKRDQNGWLECLSVEGADKTAYLLRVGLRLGLSRRSLSWFFSIVWSVFEETVHRGSLSWAFCSSVHLAGCVVAASSYPDNLSGIFIQLLTLTLRDEVTSCPDKSKLAYRYELNVHVLPKSICWKLHSQCDGIRGWGRWEMMISWKWNPSE